MKKIIFICTLLVSLFAMSGCSDDIDTPVLTTDEYPRILAAGRTSRRMAHWVNSVFH